VIKKASGDDLLERMRIAAAKSRVDDEVPTSVSSIPKVEQAAAVASVVSSEISATEKVSVGSAATEPTDGPDLSAQAATSIAGVVVVDSGVPAPPARQQRSVGSSVTKRSSVNQSLAVRAHTFT
jgi:hypothetical protein